MEENTEYRGASRILRIKIINLLYLIFIILAFLYIPSDFVDVFRDINNSYNNNKSENVKLSEYNLNILEILASNNGDSARLLYNNYLEANSYSKKILQSIERNKKFLIKKTGGYDLNRYFKSSKDYQAMEKFLLRRKVANTIRNQIISYKDSLKPIIDINTYNTIDKVLFIDNIITSNGIEKKWEDFYFRGVPMAPAITVLSKLQNDICKVDNIVLESYISLLSKDTLNIGFYDQLNDASLEWINEVVSLGEEIIILIRYTDLMNENQFNELKAFVEFKDEKVLLDIDDVGKIRFLPDEEGRYQFTVVANRRQFKKTIDVKEYGPIIEINRLPVLYAGIDNPINLLHNRTNVEDIEIEINRGEIIANDTGYFARFDEIGIIEIRVYLNEANNKRLLSSKRFNVKNIPDIRAELYERSSGVMSTKIFKAQKGIDLKSDMINIKGFIVKQFTLKRINDLLVETSTNTGAFYNSLSRRIVDKAVSGDVYVFDDIIVKDISGNEYKINSFTLNIK